MAQIDWRDVLTEKDYARLRESMRQSRQMMRKYLDERSAAIAEYVGYHYSDNGSPDATPVNFIKQAVKILSRVLAPQAPRPLVTSYNSAARVQTRKFELRLGQLSSEIKLGETLSECVTNALFGFAMVKTGLELGPEIEGYPGETLNVMRPYCDPIDPDDCVFDMFARKWGHICYIGDRYRLPLKTLQSMEDLYDPEVLKKLQADPLTNKDEEGRERASAIGQKVSEYADGEYYPSADLWDIYLPKDRVFLTVPASSDTLPPLRCTEWEGPSNGPYRVLGYDRVPSNLLPSSPVGDWMDNHVLANGLWRKCGRQAERQKTITITRDAEAGKLIKDSSDGDTITSTDPNSTTQAKYGGVEQATLGFLVMVKDMFNWTAGNLETIGGLSPSADTATQESLIKGASGAQTDAMKVATAEFAEKIFWDLGYYEWTDPASEHMVEFPVPGVENVTVPMKFGPQDRTAPYNELSLKIDPYSMQHHTPQSKLQAIMQVFQGVILPAAGTGQVQVNYDTFLRCYARFADIPELEEFVMFGGPNPDEQIRQQAGAQTGNMQSIVNQNQATGKEPSLRYRRLGATSDGKNKVLAQALFGGNPQEKEQVAAMRPVG